MLDCDKDNLMSLSISYINELPSYDNYFSDFVKSKGSVTINSIKELQEVIESLIISIRDYIAYKAAENKI